MLLNKRGDAASSLGVNWTEEEEKQHFMTKIDFVVKGVIKRVATWNRSG